MKNAFVAAAVTILVPCACLDAGAAPAVPAPASSVAGAKEQPPPVEAGDLLLAPEKYQGASRVRGMVRKVFPNQQRLGLVDAQYANCCAKPCETEKLLPVVWTGEMPKVRAVVVISGEIQRRDGKMEFVARGIEPEKPPDGTAK